MNWKKSGKKYEFCFWFSCCCCCCCCWLNSYNYCYTRNPKKNHDYQQQQQNYKTTMFFLYVSDTERKLYHANDFSFFLSFIGYNCQFFSRLRFGFIVFKIRDINDLFFSCLSQQPEQMSKYLSLLSFHFIRCKSGKHT